MNDMKEAIGAIAGLLVAGYLLLMMSPTLDAETGFNFSLWGSVYVLAAILLGVALVLGIVRTIVEQV